MEAFRGSLPKVKWPELNSEESPNPKFILCMFIIGLFHIRRGGGFFSHKVRRQGARKVRPRNVSPDVGNEALLLLQRV